MPGQKFYILLFIVLMTQHLCAQTPIPVEQLPVNIIPAAGDSTKPLVLYITGDGGWNKFSKNLAQSFADKGYAVVALNAKEYFWKKKTSTQTAADISRVIKTYQLKWKRKKILLIGYSFGADVLPFVFNLLPPDVSSQVLNINLLSPSPFTDFEIHILGMFGAGFSGGESVVQEINKISGKPISFIFGSEEKNFPVNKITIKNYVSTRLDGGHHYDGDEAKLCSTLLLHLPKY